MRKTAAWLSRQIGARELGRRAGVDHKTAQRYLQLAEWHDHAPYEFQRERLRPKTKQGEEACEKVIAALCDFYVEEIGRYHADRTFRKIDGLRGFINEVQPLLNQWDHLHTKLAEAEWFHRDDAVRMIEGRIIDTGFQMGLACSRHISRRLHDPR